MNRVIEIVAMVLGGLSIFAVCFLGFSSLSGVPLSEIPGIGGLFPEPQEQPPAYEPAGPSRPRESKSDLQLIQSGLGTLSAWSLPAPYTAEELRSLVDELKAKLLVLDHREGELEEREENLELELETLRERFTALEQLRAELEQYESELDLREDELEAKEVVRDERNRAKWQSMAPVLSSLDPNEAARKIIRYAPEDAAEILHAMADAAASSILTSIPDESFRDYLDAYSEKSPASR